MTSTSRSSASSSFAQLPHHRHHATNQPTNPAIMIELEPTSPIPALLVFVCVLVLHAIKRFMTRDVTESQRATLAFEIETLRREMSDIDARNEYARFIRCQRKHDAKKDELQALAAQSKQPRTVALWFSLAQAIVPSVLVWQYWSTPMLAFTWRADELAADAGGSYVELLVAPVIYLLSMPIRNSHSVGVLAWYWICASVCDRT